MRNSIVQAIAILCLLLAAACAGAKPALQAGENLPEYVPAKHLVFIGFDGWGGAYVSKANMPEAKRRMAEGASSLDVRCIMPSNSWPNWAAFFGGTPPEKQTSEHFPSIFTLVENANGAEASILFYQWGRLQDIFPTDNIERRAIGSDSESASLIAARIKEAKPVFTAIVFEEPDSTGHNKRWGSAAYYAKLEELDAFIEIIEQAVKNAGIYDDTVFILSSDHGGVLWGHGFNSPKQRRIPLVIYGSNIKNGYTIPARRSICDIAPTMAVILGLEIPPEWTGKPLAGVFK